MTRPLTSAQTDALIWLRRVGKATPRSCRAEGVRTLTMAALVDRGLASVEYVPNGGRPSIPVWRPREGEAVAR